MMRNDSSDTLNVNAAAKIANVFALCQNPKIWVYKVDKTTYLKQLIRDKANVNTV